MGADMIVLSWWEPVGVTRTEEMIRAAIDETFRSDRFDDEEVRVYLDYDDPEQTKEALAQMWQQFFDRIHSDRDISWDSYPTSGGEMIRQWFSGGSSWGDMATEAAEEWARLWELSDALLPGIAAKLDVYFSPFMAAAATEQYPREREA